MGIITSIFSKCFKGKTDPAQTKYSKVQTEDPNGIQMTDPELGGAKRTAPNAGGAGAGSDTEDFEGFSSFASFDNKPKKQPEPIKTPDTPKTPKQATPLASAAPAMGAVPPRSATPKSFAAVNAPTPTAAPPTVPAPFVPASLIQPVASASATASVPAVSGVNIAANMNSNIAAQSLVRQPDVSASTASAVPVTAPVDETPLFGDLEEVKKKAPVKVEPKIDFFSNMGMAPVVVEPVRKKIVSSTAAYAPTPVLSNTVTTSTAASVMPRSSAAPAPVSSFLDAGATEAPAVSSGAFSMDKMLDRASMGGGAASAWGDGDGDLDLDLGDLGIADDSAGSKKKKPAKAAKKPKKPKGLGATVVDETADL